MRDLAPQWDAWDIANGHFFGPYKPSGRVTVQPDWELRKSGTVVGTNKKGPFRWWQSNSVIPDEYEIPNVKSINIDRNLDSDAGSCTIVIYNQWHESIGDQPEMADQLGMPGFFSFNRGKNPDAVARWNQNINSWSEVLVENAMLRTYQGYGGYEDNGDLMPLEDSVSGGYTPITGVWLVDRVQIGSNGMITLTCRDMMKLLIDQVLYKPLVPSNQYPLKYYRWVYKTVNNQFDPRKPIVKGEVAEFRPRYVDSSTDRWYGPNYRLHGHRGTDSVDGNPNTFALSVGNSHPSRPFCTDWFEYEVNQNINEVYIHPWGGNYTMFVSILENGRWVDSGQGLIPYSYYPPTDTGADIPFVMRTGVLWEAGQWFRLPRTFNAQRVRITFRDHTQSPWGPWYYRCGIREIMFKINTVSQIIQFPWTFAAAAYPQGEGYLIVDDVGKMFAFGEAQVRGKNAPNRGVSSPVYAVSYLPSGQGYYILEGNGRVHGFGPGATHLGDGYSPNNQDSLYQDMAVTHTGEGYWLLRKDGIVQNFGDAPALGNMPITPALKEIGKYGLHWRDFHAKAMSGNPTDYGYVITNGSGEVRAFGASNHYGEVGGRHLLINPPLGSELITDIQTTKTGNGYWVLSGLGRLWAYGDAQHVGEGTDGQAGQTLLDFFKQVTWRLIPNQAEDGYYLIKGGGGVKMHGNADWWGQIGGAGTQRTTGNYKDYADIVKEILLWSGYWLHSDNPPGGQNPAVYGNIEGTGAYADEPLPEDMFDKVAPIDVITKLKEIVGYSVWIDQEGAFRFESPNWWASGNFFYDGSHTDFIPEVDERVQLIEYGITAQDEHLRSEIIIANGNPESDNKKTVVTRIVPDTASSLRGMVKPAMFANEALLNKSEQRIMAELIALHIWFKKRIGTVTCIGNPAIDIGDQVRIWERVTSESYVHYVRGVSSTMDLDTGVYTMNLDTNWLGDGDEWVITRDTL